MKSNLNVKAGSTNSAEFDSEPVSDRAPRSNTGAQPSYARVTNNPPERILNTWVVIEMLLQRWHWLIIGMVIGAGCFFLLGGRMVKPKFTATAQLLRYEAPGKSEYFKTQPISSETFIAMIRSPEVLREVGSKIVPPIPAETLNRLIKIDPEADSD